MPHNTIRSTTDLWSQKIIKELIIFLSPGEVIEQRITHVLAVMLVYTALRCLSVV